MRYLLLASALLLSGCSSPTYINYEAPPTTVTRTQVIHTTNVIERRMPVVQEATCKEAYHEDGDARRIEARIRADLTKLGIAPEQIEAEVRKMRSKVCQ